jgi:ABC-type antimicrobial peptide transport system permease subunit
MREKPAPGEIVGIVADVKDHRLDGNITPSVFYPHPALPIGYMSFVVRTASAPQYLAGAIAHVVHSLDSHQPVADIRTMDQVLSRSVSSRRFQMLLLIFLAAMAALLAAVGIYGVISYAVVQRTNEIGIRIALGATRWDVLRLIVRHGALILAGGLLLGTAGALALTRTISVFLFEVKPADPLTFAAVALFLLLIAITALTGPARRASRVDPLTALRF